MNKYLKKEINKIKVYLNIMFQLHLTAQIIAFETLLIVILILLNKFVNIKLNYLYLASISSILVITMINLIKYKKKTKGKFFIYRYIEKHYPPLSSSLTTIADTSLKDSASSDFIKETENLAFKEIKKIKLKNIPPIFDFNKLKLISFITSILWIFLLFPLKTDTKNLFFGKTIYQLENQIKIVNIYNLKASITPPKYLKTKKEETLENFDGSLKVYTGSELVLSGLTKERYDKCIFVYGDREQACSIDNNKFIIKHKILMNSLYYIKFINNKYKSYKFESKKYESEIIPDNPPKIKIAFPEENLTLKHKDTLQITAEANDDIAIQSIKFKYKIENSDLEMEEVNIKNLGSQRETINHTLNMSEFEKGDIITYFFEVYDNDTVLGPKISTSRRMRIEIVSEMKLHENFLKQLNLIVKEFTIELADHLVLNRKVSYRKLTLVKRDLNNKIVKTKHRLRILLKSENPLISVSSKEILNSVVERLEKSLIDDSVSRSSKDLIKTLEDSIIYITDVLDREKIEIINQLYKSLKNSKTRLGDLISDYKENRNEKTKKKILKEIRNIKRKIKRIMEKLSELSSDIDSKFINREASKVKKMAENMESLEELLENGDFDKLLKQLEDLESELNEMIIATEEKKEGLMAERDEESDKKSENFMNDLQDLVFEQEQLVQQSNKITEKLQSGIKKEMKKKGFIKKNLALLQEANNNLFNLNKDLLSNGTKEDINRIVEGINLSISFLKTKNLILTLSSLKDVYGEFRKVKESYQGLIEWMLNNRNHKNIINDYKSYKKARTNKNKVIANIEELLRKSKKSVTDEDKKKMDKLSKAQENLKKKIQKLQNEAQNMPMTPSSTKESLKKGEKNMKDAKMQLDNKNPNMAKFEQGSALNQLKAVRKSMQKQKQQANKNQMSGKEKGKGKKIKIPDENYKGPKELREDILKAMKKDAPKGHKKTVKEYFKNIIKK